MARATPENAEHYRWSIEHHSEEANRLRACVSHAEREVARIDRLYADTGRFRRGAKTTVNGLAHYDLTDES